METTSSLVLTIIQTQTSFRQAIQRSFKRHQVDMTFEMFQIMASLWRKAGVNQQELAVKTFKDKASLTYLINNLEKKGWVVRKEDTEDRRNKLIHLTEKGIAMREQVIPLLEDIYLQAAKQVNHKHLEKCLVYLQELNTALKNV